MEREIHENIRKGLEPVIPDLNDFFDSLEKQWEERLITLLEEFHIRGIVKTDKYSLPYQDEIIVKFQRESFVNMMYDFSTFVRPVIKKLLEENTYKVRFYIHAETYDDKMNVKIFKGYIGTGFKISFRYYIH